ncbi:response regulator, partial [bacterium]|nr:response regulator [bacterium]
DVTLHELSRSGERFRSIFEQSGEGIFVARGRVNLLLNPALKRIFGYAIDEIDEMSFDLSRHFSPIELETAAKESEQLINGNREEISRPVKAKDRNGQVLELHLNCRLIEWEGEPAVLGFVRDTTRESTLQRQLQQAQKMESVGRLAGGVAHDFNNILTSISGNAELAKMRLAQGPDQAMDNMNEILHIVGKASSLTRQLLAFSRSQVMAERVLNLNATLNDINKMLRRLINEDIHIELAPADDLWPVKADPTQIEQVIINLAVNARDAMPDGGTLTLETRNVYLDEEYTSQHAELRPGEYVMLAVSDTGSGIPMEIRDKIFEPFYTTKGVGKGTGLGLSTVYGIVQQSKGHIHLYSEMGRGTTFKVFLPRVYEQPDEFDQAGIENQLSSFKGDGHILLIEDEDEIREMLTSLLSGLGYKVTAAEDGAEALMKAEAMKIAPDLLLTDVVMPKINGPQVHDALRVRWPDLRVLFMSGYAERAVQQNILSGDLPFLQKPFQSRELVQRLRSIL